MHCKTSCFSSRSVGKCVFPDLSFPFCAFKRSKAGDVSKSRMRAIEQEAQSQDTPRNGRADSMSSWRRLD